MSGHPELLDAVRGQPRTVWITAFAAVIAFMGIGLSVGPLLGGISWRGPFFGTAALMAVALVLCATMLPSDAAEQRAGVGLLDPVRALRHGGLFRTSAGAALCTAAFFTVLAWSPFVLRWGAVQIGLVFFGWGLCVAVAGVVLAPRLAARFGERRATVLAVIGFAALMLVMSVDDKAVLVVAVILSGVVSGLLNTLFTGTAMSISPAPRPVASAGYNFLRWLGGAAAATLVGHVAEWFGSPHAPFAAAAVLCAVAVGLLSIGGPRPDVHVLPAEAVLVGDEAVG